MGAGGPGRGAGAPSAQLLGQGARADGAPGLGPLGTRVLTGRFEGAGSLGVWLGSAELVGTLEHTRRGVEPVAESAPTSQNAELIASTVT